MRRAKSMDCSRRPRTRSESQTGRARWRCYRQAILIDPNNPLARMKLEYLCRDRDIWDEALEQLTRATAVSAGVTAKRGARKASLRTRSRRTRKRLWIPIRAPGESSRAPLSGLRRSLQDVGICHARTASFAAPRSRSHAPDPASAINAPPRMDYFTDQFAKLGRRYYFSRRLMTRSRPLVQDCGCGPSHVSLVRSSAPPSRTGAFS